MYEREGSFLISLPRALSLFSIPRVCCRIWIYHRRESIVSKIPRLTRRRGINSHHCFPLASKRAYWKSTFRSRFLSLYFIFFSLFFFFCRPCKSSFGRKIDNDAERSRNERAIVRCNASACRWQRANGQRGDEPPCERQYFTKATLEQLPNRQTGRQVGR